MERYIGMGAHAASCTLAVISEKRRKLEDFSVETNGQALAGTRALRGEHCAVSRQTAWGRAPRLSAARRASP